MKQLIAMIDTKDKSPEQVHEELMQAIQMNQGASPEPKPEIAMRDSGNDILEKSGKDWAQVSWVVLSHTYIKNTLTHTNKSKNNRNKQNTQ